MNLPTQTDASINYSALNESVTSADVTAYKQQLVGKGMFNNPNAWVMYPWVLYVMVFFFAVALYLPVTLFVSALDAPLGAPTLVWLALMAAGFFGAYKLFDQYVKNSARLYKFTTQNNLKLILAQPDPSYAGMIFDEGHSRVISMGLVFPGRAELGNYTYVTGGGKNRSTHYWAYIKVKLPRKLPHMVLDAKKNNLFGRFSNLTDTFNKEQTLALEGDFNNYFTLYAPKQYERDALYVFTPDVMAKLIDNGSSYDMEVINDELYIYKSGRVKLDSETELKSLLAIVGAIGTDLRDQTDYYADERVGDRTQNIIAPQGAKLKTGVNWVVVAIIIFVVLYHVLTFFSSWQ